MASTTKTTLRMQHSSFSVAASAAGALEPLVGLGFFFGRFCNNVLWGRVLCPTPNPQPGGPGYPFVSGSSPLTCLAQVALPVASNRPHSSQDHFTMQSPLCQSKATLGGWVGQHRHRQHRKLTTFKA